MRKESKELGLLRRKQKCKLFKRFRIHAIEEVAKSRLFALFENCCFKCGVIEKLDMDHHIPLVRDGKLEPGNIVALCRTCNDRKHNKMPIQFYTEAELNRLDEIFPKQKEIFEFEFDWKAWEEDRMAYLLKCGVDAGVAHQTLNDPEYRYYIPPKEESKVFTISAGDFLERLEKASGDPSSD